MMNVMISNCNKKTGECPTPSTQSVVITPLKKANFTQNIRAHTCSSLPCESNKIQKFMLLLPVNMCKISG